MIVAGDRRASARSWVAPDTAPPDSEVLLTRDWDSVRTVVDVGGIGQCSGCRTRSSSTCLCKPDRTTPASPQCTPTDFTVAGG